MMKPAFASPYTRFNLLFPPTFLSAALDNRVLLGSNTMTTNAVNQEPASPPAPAKAAILRRNYLSALENVAQAVGTMGPAATLGTVIPLLIAKTGNGTWLLFLGILAVFILISININVFASRFVSAGSLSSYAEKGLGGWPGILTGWSYIVAMTFIVTSSVVANSYYLGMVMAHFTHRPIGKVGSILLTMLVVVLAWFPAYRDIKLSTKVLLCTEAISVSVIACILGIAMTRSGHALDQAQLHLAGAGFPQFKMGLVLAFMMLAGFESATTLGEEAQSATRTIPRVMFFCLLPIGLLFMAGIYSITALSHSRNIGFDQTNAPLDADRPFDRSTCARLDEFSGGCSQLLWVCFGRLERRSEGYLLHGPGAPVRALFREIHPANGTPSRALLVMVSVALIIPSLLVVCGVAMANSMDYLMQIASFGFLGGYFSVCVAAPFYLARRHALTATQLLVGAITLLVIGAVLFLSLIPIPAAPWRYLPYLFAVLVFMGTVSSVYYRGRLRA
jgi:amino acid transporter